MTAGAVDEGEVGAIGTVDVDTGVELCWRAEIGEAGGDASEAGDGDPTSPGEDGGADRKSVV